MNLNSVINICCFYFGVEFYACSNTFKDFCVFFLFVVVLFFRFLFFGKNYHHYTVEKLQYLNKRKHSFDIFEFTLYFQFSYFKKKCSTHTHFSNRALNRTFIFVSHWSSSAASQLTSNQHLLLINFFNIINTLPAKVTVVYSGMRT